MGISIQVYFRDIEETMVNRKNDRPNLIFILSDDQGSWAMNCSGTKELNTPNLNRLAKEGILFDNFFCSSPVCSPARASILTWQFPSAHGFLDFLRRCNSSLASKIAKHAEDGIEITYMEGQTSYIQDLANAGYVCGLSGKWHLGNSRLPQLGFSYWNVHAGGDGNYYSAPMWTNFNFYEPEGYVTDVITDNAIEFLEDQKGKNAPFSLNIHYTAPHAPWNRENHPIQRFDSYFNNSSFDEMPNQKIHRDHLQKHPLASLLGDTPDNRRSALSGYFTSIEEMDRNIGRVIDWLEVNNLRDKFNKTSSLLGERDIGTLGVAKPRPVGKIITKGTQNVFRCFEIVSGAPLTEKETNAEKPSQLNTSCPSVANPNRVQ